MCFLHIHVMGISACFVSKAGIRSLDIQISGDRVRDTLELVDLKLWT
jgi:hypothetical protein